MSVTEIGDLLRDAPFRWWMGGGRALQLHLGRTWRDHADTDIGILRPDVGALGLVLDEWDLHVAAAGRLTAWRGSRSTRRDTRRRRLLGQLPVDHPWRPLLADR